MYIKGMNLPTPPDYLKPRQAEAFDSVFNRLEKWGGTSRQLVALPTGVGKTVLALAIARQFEKTLFLVHRQELLDQTLQTYGRYYDEPVGIIWGGNNDIGERLTVGMIQTLYSRLHLFGEGLFDCVVIDEAHHASARTWAEVAEHFKPILRLGLSATPERNDGAPLTNLFDDISYQMSVKDAVKENYLVEPLAMTVTSDVQLDSVGTVAGDFNQKQLAQAVNTRTRNIAAAEAFKENGKGRRAVGFTVDIAHAQDAAETFEECGVVAQAVWGNDPDRAYKLEAHKGGEFDVLFNALVLTEGYDDPSVDAIINMRPTKSKSLYTQMVGRGLRLFDGKDDCLILDVTDASNRHRLINVWDFWGIKLKAKIDSPTPLSIAETEAKEDLAPAVEMFDYVTGRALNIEAYLERVDLFNPPPPVDRPDLWTQGWHHDDATEKQLMLLEKEGFDIYETMWTKGQAAHVIGALPPTNKQRKLLLALGFDVVGRDWTRDEASAAFKVAEKHGYEPNWKLISELSEPRRKLRRVS